MHKMWQHRAEGYGKQLTSNDQTYELIFDDCKVVEENKNMEHEKTTIERDVKQIYSYVLCNKTYIKKLKC